MVTAPDDSDLARLSPHRRRLPGLAARPRKWLPYAVLAGAVLLGLLFPRV